MTDKGRVYHLGANRNWVQAGERIDFSNGWPAFCWAAWSFLWERKEIYFTIWGPFRIKHRRFRKLWRTAFGTCPFSWRDGPGNA